MKTQIRYSILVSVILIAGLSSCKKYLDKKPNAQLAVPRTLADAQALLDNPANMNEDATPSYLESAADDYFHSTASFNALDPFLQAAYIWQRYEYNYPNDWASAYKAVTYANFCLELLDNIPVDAGNRLQWNNVKGSALFFRAYYFLQLAWQYAKAYDAATADTDLGIVLKESSDHNLPSVRASVKATYDKIINDAKAAVDYLPDLPAHAIRPSKAAAYGLLSRAYLSTRMYDSAYKYADRCLQLKSDLIDYNMAPCSGCDIVTPITATAPPFKKFNSETIFYTDMYSHVAAHYLYYGSLSDTTLYGAYGPDDLRKSAFFNSSDVYPTFRGSYAQNLYTFFTGIATDEMYLTRAECYAREGDLPNALIDLNTLLKKRHNAGFVPVTATDAHEALAKILVERRKELVHRGLRWNDIKRLNKEGANIIPERRIDNQTYTLQPNSDKYALPIPSDIIRQTGLSQNPGWEH